MGERTDEIICTQGRFGVENPGVEDAVRLGARWKRWDHDRVMSESAGNKRIRIAALGRDSRYSYGELALV